MPGWAVQKLQLMKNNFLCSYKSRVTISFVTGWLSNRGSLASDGKRSQSCSHPKLNTEREHKDRVAPLYNGIIIYIKYFKNTISIIYVHPTGPSSLRNAIYKIVTYISATRVTILVNHLLINPYLKILICRTDCKMVSCKTKISQFGILINVAIGFRGQQTHINPKLVHSDNTKREMPTWKHHWFEACKVPVLSLLFHLDLLYKNRMGNAYVLLS